jgi:hypothetical protein
MDHRFGRIIMVPLIALLLGLFVAVVLGFGMTPERAQAQIAIYVDDDTCPAVGSGTQIDPYCHIQDAVDAALDGYEVRVAAGTYTGTQTVAVQQAVDVYTYTQVVVITKSLTLQGGYSPDDWYTPDPTANPTVIDAERQGRGISIVGTYNIHPEVTVDGFTVTGGDYTGLGNPPGEANRVCAGTGADCGGGFYAYECAFTLRNSIVTDNIASHDYGNGGGIYFLQSAGPGSRIENTLVVSNSAPGSGGAGGGMFSVRVDHPLTITHSTFQDNYAQQSGGGLHLGFNIKDLVTVSETDFFSNTAQTDLGGGVRVRMSQNGEILRMDRVRFQYNQANSRGGALFLDAAGLVTPKARLTNLLFTGNRLTSAGAEDAIIGIDGAFTSLEVELAHVTAADNSAVTFLYAQSSHNSGTAVTVTLTNTLLSFFTNAFAAQELDAGEEVVIQHNRTLTQYVSNLHQNEGGSPTFTAIDSLAGDPKLSDSYHLQFGSAAIDAGVDAGVTVDIDGDARPQGDAPDIGADELVIRYIFLPTVLRN